MRLIAIAALVLGALVPGAGAQAQAPAQAPETPQRGGTLVFAVNAEPPTYDCMATTTFAAVQTLNPHYSQLLKYDAEHYPQVRGDVAERWEVSADGLSYTFHLRANVRFHDGTTLTSEDVKATFDRIRNPSAGLVSVRQSDYEDIETIETPDPRTVIFRLRAPAASMLLNFASPWNCLYSAARLRADPRWPERNVMAPAPSASSSTCAARTGRARASRTTLRRAGPISTASAPCSWPARR